MEISSQQQAQGKYACITIVEGKAFDGAVALLNSVIRAGFTGHFYIFYRGKLPQWTASLHRLSPGVFQVGEAKVIFKLSTYPHRLSFSKPASMLEVLAEQPELEGVFYADPDITVLAPWSFFESWIAQGVALGLDSQFPWVHERNPWRATLTTLISKSGLSVVSNRREYASSSFLGVPRAQAQMLENWELLTQEYHHSDADLKKLKKSLRVSLLADDQDLLMAALSTIEEEPAYIGREALGFNNHFFIMSRSVESIKPWNKHFVLAALGGIKATEPNLHWLQNLREPIEGISKLRWYTKIFDYKASLLISRCWRR